MIWKFQSAFLISCLSSSVCSSVFQFYIFFFSSRAADCILTKNVFYGKPMRCDNVELFFAERNSALANYLRIWIRKFKWFWFLTIYTNLQNTCICHRYDFLIAYNFYHQAFFEKKIFNANIWSFYDHFKQLHTNSNVIFSNLKVFDFMCGIFLEYIDTLRHMFLMIFLLRAIFLPKCTVYLLKTFLFLWLYTWILI